jgi:hypothetical protein
MRRTIRNGPIDVDQIVANYTALGRAQRRKTGKRRMLKVGIAASAAVAAALVWWSGLPMRVLDTRSDAVSDLRAIVESELQQLTAARADLAAERDRYAAKSSELETELAAFADRHDALEAQQADLTAQSAELRAALAKVDAERAALVAAAPNPALERELVAIGKERRALEERSRSFSDQGRQLSTELEALEQQRSALEAERAGMERQRRDLESLLDAAAAGPSASADALEPSPAPDAGLDPLFASAVDATDLGEMRGGVLLGNGMNIAIGLTRTATINGEEQYASALRIDDLTAGLDPAALDAMRPLVIQNGTGNSIAPGLLDDWSAGFGTIIQNSRDNQAISTSTIYDVQVQDVGQAIRDMAGSQAVTDSLSFHH